jgi:hypothetical protein
MAQQSAELRRKVSRQVDGQPAVDENSNEDLPTVNDIIMGSNNNNIINNVTAQLPPPQTNRRPPQTNRSRTANTRITTIYDFERDEVNENSAAGELVLPTTGEDAEDEDDEGDDSANNNDHDRDDGSSDALQDIADESGGGG